MEKFIILSSYEKKLSNLGYNFSTSSDTEVLLKAYIEYGESCVHYFNGMWSFAIWDGVKEKLFLSRDRFGENLSITSSEIKMVYILHLKKRYTIFNIEKTLINYSYLNRYMVYGYKFLYKDGKTFFIKNYLV